ncbi:MAG: sugar phosphate isomerase/epimerase [Gillisia sp.]|nr:sugar phosphate isomerase/epimerase [Gillisia sp.]
MIHRKTFLKLSGLALAGTVLMPSMAFSSNKERTLGLQLYSLRDIIDGNVKDVMKKLAEVGFKEIETYGYSPKGKFWGFEVKEFKKILDGNGLVTPSGHYGMNDFLGINGTDSDFNYLLDVANTLEQKYVVVPHIAEDLRTSINDYKRLTDKLNRAGEMCQKAGLKLAYHNHDFEFFDYNGENGFDVFLQNTDKDLVDFEVDLYWVIRAGKDPVSLFEKYPGRFKLWHVKDMSRKDSKLNTEIGSGSINFEEIFNNAEKSGVEHVIIEQENFEMDPYQSLTKSFDYIQNNL